LGMRPGAPAASGRHPVPSARQPVDLGRRTGRGAAAGDLGKGRARNLGGSLWDA
jgi:hypothetical protein